MGNQEYRFPSSDATARINPAIPYFSEADYSQLYALAPNIQSALEALNTAVVVARKDIKDRLKYSEKAE